MSTRNAIAIEIGTRRVRALLAARDGSRVHVKRVLVEEIPPDVDAEDPKALGEWIGGRLGAAGFPTGRATVAVPRQQVVLKRLELPSPDERELPAMTRLALQRELPFDADSAVIDYVAVGRSATHTTVLAVAAPAKLIETTRAVVRAAGLGIERIALRSMGSAALIGSALPDEHACVLAVDVSGDGVEFCVIERGAIRFSRAAEIPLDGDGGMSEDDAIAAGIVTETRRTWMSYRIVEDASDVSRVTMMGAAPVVERAVGPIAEMLGVSSDVLDRHPQVESNGASIDRVWPLAGLLMEPGLRDRETIDFARPRRPVARSARSRRWALAAAGVLVVAVLAAWTAGRRNLDALRTTVASLETRAAQYKPRVQRSQRDRYRLEHIEQWKSVDVRWLEHLVALQGLAPRPDEVVLDGWTGTLEFRGVRYDRAASSFAAPREVVIVVEGEARDRTTADALREALVEADWYRARSTGSDAPGGRRLSFGFTYRLSTAMDAPPSAVAPNAPGRAEERDE